MPVDGSTEESSIQESLGASRIVVVERADGGDAQSAGSQDEVRGVDERGRWMSGDRVCGEETMMAKAAREGGMSEGV